MLDTVYSQQMVKKYKIRVGVRGFVLDFTKNWKHVYINITRNRVRTQIDLQAMCEPDDFIGVTHQFFANLLPT